MLRLSRRRSHASATLWVAIGAGQMGESLTRQTAMQEGSVAGYAGMGYAARDLARRPVNSWGGKGHPVLVSGSVRARRAAGLVRTRGAAPSGWTVLVLAALSRVPSFP